MPNTIPTSLEETRLKRLLKRYIEHVKACTGSDQLDKHDLDYSAILDSEALELTIFQQTA
jgi:hypothetical protein